MRRCNLQYSETIKTSCIKHFDKCRLHMPRVVQQRLPNLVCVSLLSAVTMYALVQYGARSGCDPFCLQSVMHRNRVDVESKLMSCRHLSQSNRCRLPHESGPSPSEGGPRPCRRPSSFSQGAYIGATFWGIMKAKTSIQCVGIVRGPKALHKRCRRKRESAICCTCEQSVRKHADPKLMELLNQGIESLKEEPLAVRKVEDMAEDVHKSIFAHYDASRVPCVGITYEYRDERVVWQRCGVLRDTGICGACFVRSEGFISDKELQGLRATIKGTGPASHAALDYACTISNLILVRRQAAMRKHVEAALVSIL